MERPSFSSAPTVGELVRSGARFLESTSSSSRLDSEVLLRHLLGYSRTQVILQERTVVEPELVTRFTELLIRRAKGEPTAYISGEREFWGLSFRVSPAVLVPRPESELLIEEALLFARGRDRLRFVDLGTGSGCLALSLLSELIKKGCDARCVAVDISPDALEVARSNAHSLRLEQFVTFVQGSWFSPRGHFAPPYDLILANPPYIDPSEKVPIELSYEPSQALFSEDAGLKDVHTIIQQSAEMVNPGGLLLCEVGAGKRRMLGETMRRYSDEWELQLLGDTSAADRFTVLKMVRR